MKIRQKILAAPAIALGLMIPLVGYGGFALHAQRQAMTNVVNVRNAALDGAYTHILDLAGVHIQAYRYVSWLGRADDKVLANVQKELKGLVQAARDNLKQIGEAQNLTEGERQQIAKLLADYEGYAKLVASAVDMGDVDQAAANQMMQTSDERFRALHKAVKGWIAEEKSMIAETVAHSDRSFALLMAAGGALTLVALLASTLASLWIARRIAAPLVAAADMAERMADGHIVAVPSVPVTDEATAMLTSLSRMSSNLGKLLAHVNDVAVHVETASADIASIN